MIRVLIVEDEPPIARALAALVDRHPAFEAAGMASDGEAALRRLEEENIQVVITDIRMPVMDGLTLLQSIHQLYPQICTVLLSGYQVFSYARTAVEYQAFDYLLKPISRDQLYKVLDRIEIAWSHQNVELRRRQIGRAIGGEELEKSEAGGRDCYALLICAGAFPQSGTDLLLPGQAFWNSVDCEHFLEGRACRSVFTFNGNHNTEKIVIAEYDGQQAARETAGALFNYLNEAGNIPVTAVGHALPIGVPEVGRVISRLRTILFQEIRLFRPLLVWRDCMEPTPIMRGGAAKMDMAFEPVVEAIIAQDEQRLATLVRGSLEYLHSSDDTQVHYVRFLDSILNDSRLAYRMDTREYSAVKLELNEAIANTVSLEGLARDLTAILGALSGETAGRRDMQDTIDQVEQFLRANFNKSISSELLASKYGFVPSYLSKMFRKYKKVSPSEYLVRLRMQKAKELLQSQPDMLVRDIAIHVGYRDPHYFSKIFKRETGIWPTEFQHKKTANL